MKRKFIPFPGTICVRVEERREGEEMKEKRGGIQQRISRERVIELISVTDAPKALPAAGVARRRRRHL